MKYRSKVLIKRLKVMENKFKILIGDYLTCTYTNVVSEILK